MVSTLGITYNIKLRAITFCKYELKISKKLMMLTFPQLLQLRTDLYRLTSSESLFEIIQNDNFELLFIADKQHLLLLDVEQLLDLKDEIAIFFEDVNSFSF